LIKTKETLLHGMSQNKTKLSRTKKFCLWNQGNLKVNRRTDKIRSKRSHRTPKFLLKPFIGRKIH